MVKIPKPSTSTQFSFVAEGVAPIFACAEQRCDQVRWTSAYAEQRCNQVQWPSARAETRCD